jgi:ParB family chromosome partitioning protein
MAKLNRSDAFSSILGSAKTAQRSGERQLPLEEIRLNPEQPRKFFDEEALGALAANIKEKGVLQPVLVRERGDAYELVAGERRYRAAQRAGLETIPVIIRELSDEESLEIALIENLQREDLNPVEETDGTLKLLSLKLDIPVQDVLEAIRQSHYRALGRTDNNVVINPHVAGVEGLFRTIGRYTASSFYSHRVPILKMPEALVQAVRAGRLEYSKARALAGVKDEALRVSLLQLTLENDLSLKQLKEEIGKQAAPERATQQGRAEAVDLAGLKRKLTPSRIDKLPSAKQRELGKLLARLDALLED